MIHLTLGIALVLAGTTAATVPDVKTYGELRAVMHEGDVGAKVGLATLLKGPHVFAIGALSELRGEVTVVDGVAWLAYPGADGKARVERVSRSNEQATLLVATNVTGWRDVAVTKSIAFGDLDAALESVARDNQVDAGRPFAFLVTGTVEDLEWHVIDGRKLAAGGRAHHDHAKAGVRFSRSRVPATLVGFYSSAHHGVFTHMGSNTHIHVVIPSVRGSGHVDRVTIPKGATFRLPR